MKFIFAIAVMSLYAAANSQPAEIKIIANPGVAASEISRDELKRIFLMTKTSLPGADHVEPVLEKRGAPQDAFLREYIGRTDAALMIYYRGLMFTGKATIPKSFGSDAEITEYVAKTSGAIGYVAATYSTVAVKVLKVK